MREEFREEWASYYAARREHGDSEHLAEIRADIVERQKALTGHREARADLHDRQADNQSSPQLLNLVNGGPEHLKLAEFENGELLQNRFEQAATEVFNRGNDFGPRDAEYEAFELPPQRLLSDPISIGPKTRDPIDGMTGLGIGALGGIAEIGEKLFDGFLGGSEPVKRPPPRPLVQMPEFPPDNPFRRSAEAAQRQIEEQEEKRSRDYWDDRERSRD